MIDMAITIAVTRQMGDDIEVVVKYVKNDLYEKVKFIYDPKVDLAVNGLIYTHYKSKCSGVLGNRTVGPEAKETYLQNVWTTAMTRNVQKNALAMKRSAVYTVMQNKFSGTCEWVCQITQHSFHFGTNTIDKQICVRIV